MSILYILISTRLFCALPSAVAFEATGTASPRPVDEILLTLNPFVSTKYVYTTLDLNTNTVHPDIDGMKKALEDGNLYGITERMGNVLQDVTIPAYLEVERIKEQMKTLGAVNAMMSGSGPTVFGLYETKEKARKAAAKIREKQLAKQVYVTGIHNARRK